MYDGCCLFALSPFSVHLQPHCMHHSCLYVLHFPATEVIIIIVIIITGRRVLYALLFCLTFWFSSKLTFLNLSGCSSGRMSIIDLYRQHFSSDACLWVVPNRIQQTGDQVSQELRGRWEEEQK